MQEVDKIETRIDASSGRFQAMMLRYQEREEEAQALRTKERLRAELAAEHEAKRRLKEERAQREAAEGEGGGAGSSSGGGGGGGTSAAAAEGGEGGAGGEGRAAAAEGSPRRAGGAALLAAFDEPVSHDGPSGLNDEVAIQSMLHQYMKRKRLEYVRMWIRECKQKGHHSAQPMPVDNWFFSGEEGAGGTLADDTASVRSVSWAAEPRCQCARSCQRRSRSRWS